MNSSGSNFLSSNIFLIIDAYLLFKGLLLKHEWIRYPQYSRGVIYKEEIFMLSLIESIRFAKYNTLYRVEPLRSPKKSCI